MTRSVANGIVVVTLAVAALLPGQVATAQQTSPAHAHIGHVMDEWRDTPDGRGLLPTAVGEAEVAAQHASLAARDPNNLDAMKLHTGHVIHAVAPSEEPSGPGLGYGVKRAAEGTATHIELAADADGASQNVSVHSTHVATSARNTVQRADEVVRLAKQIQAASSASAAAPLVEQLRTLAEQLVTGADADGDGQVGWQEGEGGLEQAEQHMMLMMRGEDIS